MDADVIVVGAGLAGLRCARVLQDAGRQVVVLEAAAHVGGRVTSETIDGFVVDRGFQVLNPAYPAVRRWVDVSEMSTKASTSLACDARCAILPTAARSATYCFQSARSTGTGLPF